MNIEDREVAEVTREICEAYQDHAPDICGTSLAIATGALIQVSFPDEGRRRQGLIEFVRYLGRYLGVEMEVSIANPVSTPETMH